MSEKKIDTGQIKSTVITDDLPEIQESLSTAIEDNSKEHVTKVCDQVKQCNTHLKSALKQMNNYLNSMAEAFEEMDSSLGKVIEEGTQKVSSSASKSNQYSHLL